MQKRVRGGERAEGEERGEKERATGSEVERRRYAGLDYWRA